MLAATCYEREEWPAQTDEVLCELYTYRGNSGSMHLDAVAIYAGAQVAGGSISRNALYFQPRNQTVPYDAYLYSTFDDGSGDPAGLGPWRGPDTGAVRPRQRHGHTGSARCGGRDRPAGYPALLVIGLRGNCCVRQVKMWRVL